MEGDGGSTEGATDQDWGNREESIGMEVCGLRGMQVGFARGARGGKGREGRGGGRREEGDEVIMKMGTAGKSWQQIHNQSITMNEKVGERQIRTSHVPSGPFRTIQGQSGPVRTSQSQSGPVSASQVNFRSFPVRFPLWCHFRVMFRYERSVARLGKYMTARNPWIRHADSKWPFPTRPNRCTRLKLARSQTQSSGWRCEMERVEVEWKLSPGVARPVF